VSFQSDQDGSRCNLSKNSPENQACRCHKMVTTGRQSLADFCFLARPCEELAFSLIE
jgi:hypothetical protein